MSTPVRALIFGEILWDIIEGKEYIGGAPLNFAAHSVKCGGASTIVSAVGDDELGRRALEYVHKLDVDASGVYVHPNKPTGTVDVFLNDGQPDYTIHEDVAYDFIPLSVLLQITTQTYDVFYFGTLAQRHATSRATLQALLEQHNFRHVFYDINIRKNFFTDEIVKYSLEQCSVFKINDDEVSIIAQRLYNESMTFDAFASRISQDYAIDTIIITAGAKGCYVWSGEKLHYIPGIAVKVADTVGAGDSFSAAFMMKLCQGSSAVDAARFGNQVGAYVASSHGPIPEYSDEIKKTLAG